MKRRRVIAGLAALAALGGALLLRLTAPSGAVLATVTVGLNPSALTVDTRTRLLFVLNRGALDGFSNPTGRGSISILDARGGAVLRVVPVGMNPSAIAVDTGAGHAFVVERSVSTSSGIQVTGGAVTMLDTRDGRRLRTIAVPQEPQAIMVDEHGGRVYAIGAGALVNGAYGSGTLDVLDARSGGLLRAVSVGSYPNAVAVDARTERVFVANFLGGSVSVLDRRSLRQRRAVRLGVPAAIDPGALAVDARTGRVFCVNFPPPCAACGGSARGSVTILDATSGARVRTVAQGSPYAVILDERAGRAFVVDAVAGLRMLGARSGRVLRTIHVDAYPSPAALAVDERIGRLFVVGSGRDGGWLSVLDTHSGRLLRRIAVGFDPIAVALDAEMQRVYVLNGGGSVPTPDPWGWIPSWSRRWLGWLPRGGPRTRVIPGSISIIAEPT